MKGYSIFEILIAVVVLGVLAAVVTPRLAPASGPPAGPDPEDVARMIQEKISLYHDRHGVYPSLEELTAPSARIMSPRGEPYPSWGALIDGRFLDRPPVNPRTGGSAVGDGEGADWRYDPATGRVTPGG